MDGADLRPADLTGVAIPGRPGRFDLRVADGRVAMLPSQADGGGLVLPLLTDAHVHLDKTFTAHRLGDRPASLHAAIALCEADRGQWTPADIRFRATRALERAWRHGTGAMRSHVDWTTAEVPPAWPVLCELRQEWRGRVELQLAALVPLDLFAEAGASIAARVEADGGVLGAFVYRNRDIGPGLGRVFELAVRHDLDLDFHVDEGLEPEAAGFDHVVALTARHGLRGRVLAGHGCALSVRPEAEVREQLAAAAAAGVTLCVMPTTNAWLQDALPGRTPRLRGIAPLIEARAAGVDVVIASDNCRDAFYPHGDYDLMDAFRAAVLAGHLDADAWLDAITALPARIGGGRGLSDGGPADFVWYDADDADDLVARPRAARRVWRGGRTLQEEETAA